MAGLKHFSKSVSKSSYRSILKYLVFQHGEDNIHHKIKDSEGNLVMREDFILDGINCDPYTFPQECKKLNHQYHKNMNNSDTKMHHYIIGFGPEDIGKGLTPELAQKIAMEFVNKAMPGFQTLVCTHDERNRGSYIHVHIIFNSIRKYAITDSLYEMKEWEKKAGNKFRTSRGREMKIKQLFDEICMENGLPKELSQYENQRVRISDREHIISHYQQKQLDKLNQELIAEGYEPAVTEYKSYKQQIRDAVDEVAQNATDWLMFEDTLEDEYGITPQIKDDNYVYKLNEYDREIKGRSLGTDYEKAYLENKFNENREKQRQRVSERKKSIGLEI